MTPPSCTPSFLRQARSLTRAVTHWHVQTQLGARRNALVAGTAIAQRRHEAAEVAAFLAARHAALGAEEERSGTEG